MVQENGYYCLKPLYYMVQNTIQIATFGEDQDGIVAGIRNFPVHKLVLLCYEDEKSHVFSFIALFTINNFPSVVKLTSILPLSTLYFY